MALSYKSRFEPLFFKYRAGESTSPGGGWDHLQALQSLIFHLSHAYHENMLADVYSLR